MKLKCLWNKPWSSGKEVDGHTKRAGSQRAMERGSTGSSTCWTMPWAAEPCDWPGHPTSGVALPGLGQNCLLQGHLLWRKTFFWQRQRNKKSEAGVQTGCIAKASLKAWLRLVCRLPHFLLAWWKLLSRFLELAVQKYTPFLSTHLYIASFCNAASPSEAVSRWHQLNVVLKSEAEVLGLYLSEQAGSQMDVQFAWPYCGVTTCTVKLQTNTVALWVFLFATMIPLLVPLRGCRGQARAARCTPAATSTGHPSAPQAFPSSSVAGDVLLCKRPRCAPLLPGTQALILVFDLQL